MDNIFEKIFPVVEIDKLNSKEEFDNLILMLTNHPTPLREAVAYKLEDVFDEKYLDENSSETILLAITDINPNISRSVCSIIKNSSKLQNMLEEKIILKIEDILDKIPNNEKNKNNKSHAKNKLLFSLYWLLEALFCCLSDRYLESVDKILQSAISFSDYTIREKAAQILSKLDNPDIKLIKTVEADSNFYVNFYSKLFKKQCL